MNRKIGEIFLFRDVQLEVYLDRNRCNECYLDSYDFEEDEGCRSKEIIEITGECYGREGLENVIFKKIKK